MTKLDQMPRALRGAKPRADGTPEGVNYSQLMDFMRCRYRWHLRNRRLIERRTVIVAPDLGSMVHAGIAQGIRVYDELGSPKKLSKGAEGSINTAATQACWQWAKEWEAARGTLSPDTQAELTATLANAILIAHRALRDLDLPRWEIIYLKKQPLVEHKIWWDIPGVKGIRFYGTQDRVAKDRKDGGTWVMDYKVRERFTTPEEELFDLQLPTYQVGLARNGIPTTGSIKFQIRASVPAEPKRNKDGSMSRARIATTWEVYEKALRAAKLNPAHYEEEMRQKLDIEFFRSERIYRNSYLIEQLWNEVTVPLVKQYLKAKRFPRVMTSWGGNGCPSCWAREFCLAELRGEDTDFLLQTSFVDQHKPQPKLALSVDDFEFTD